MQAIITRRLSPTNFRGSRYKATCYAGSITVSAQCELNDEQNHEAARKALCDKITARCVAEYGETRSVWLAPMVTGHLHTGEYVHVFKG